MMKRVRVDMEMKRRKGNTEFDRKKKRVDKDLRRRSNRRSTRSTFSFLISSRLMPPMFWKKEEEEDYDERDEE